MSFLRRTSAEELDMLFDKIELVGDDKPTEEQVKNCVANGWYDENVSRKTTDDWYCLLQNVQGNFLALLAAARNGRPVYMENNAEFIKDSLFCEYAYIANLDTKMLEFYVGFQKRPQEGNRYGTEPIEGSSGRKYYPCRLAAEIPFDDGALLRGVETMIEAVANG